MHTSELVQRFVSAVNGADSAAAEKLVTEDVEIAGPRGSARGIDALRDWVQRAGIHLETDRLYHGDGVAVAALRARWPGDDHEHHIGMVFRLREGRIGAVARYDDLADAVAASGPSFDPGGG